MRRNGEVVRGPQEVDGPIGLLRILLQLFRIVAVPIVGQDDWKHIAALGNRVVFQTV
jgi:hypothetical protein